ncbi:MAG: glutamate--tRNA ligase [Coriobacteriia bacterium]|nr:glutamate--tRNA ligase [Coriobacteriia bacterium]
MSKVRVRFAPSPTGMLHIGGARTAIDNWAFARAQGGDFILRIEDTDPERSTEENTQIILRAMKWLGLDWDEGPFFQMQRLEKYEKALNYLIDKGAAYPCFCTKEEIQAKREAGNKSGYDRTCRDIPIDEAKARIESGESHVWRLKVPLEHDNIEFDDAVYGHMSFPIDVMDDLVLVRPDGVPTYNFAVVVDDSDMEITHVVRGDDHLSNTPRQILIYELLDRDIPTFAHLSMILGPDGKKLSKRHGSTSVEEYRDRGYLPEALVNYLALLGWSLDDKTTIIPKDVLCKEFSLDRITKKDAIFDETKLNWMNGVYIREMGIDEFVKRAKPWFDSVSPDAWKAAPLIIERVEKFEDIPEKLGFLSWGPELHLDEKSTNKVLKKEGAKEALAAAREVIANKDWDIDSLQNACQTLCEKLAIKPRKFFQPLRVAVCGNMVSPPLFESIVLMKREDVLARIDYAIDLAL